MQNKVKFNLKEAKNGKHARKSFHKDYRINDKVLKSNGENGRRVHKLKTLCVT